MERQNSFSPSPQLKPSLRFSHTPRADPVKSGAIFKQNLPTPRDTPSSAIQTPSPQFRSPQQDHHNAPEPSPVNQSGFANRPENKVPKGNVSAPLQQYDSPINADGPLIRPSPYGRFLPNPSPTPFGVAAWASSDLGQQISANFDALVRQSPAPRVLQTQVRQQALSPPHMRSPPNAAFASPKQQSREDASRLMPPPRSSPRSQLKNDPQQQEPYSNLTHIKEWIGRQAGDSAAAQTKDEVPWQAVHNPPFRTSPNQSKTTLAASLYASPHQTNQKLELPPGYTLLFRDERLQEQAEPSGLRPTSQDNQPFNQILQLQPGSVLRSHSEKGKGRASGPLDQETFSTPNSQAGLSPMTRSRLKAGDHSKLTEVGSTPPVSRAKTDPPLRGSWELDLNAPASLPRTTRAESARLEARGLSAFLSDEGDEADPALGDESPPPEDGFDQGQAEGIDEKAGANEREDSERTQSDAAEGYEGPEEVVNSQRKNPPRALRGVRKDSPNSLKSGETRGINMREESKQGQNLGAVRSPEKEPKALSRRAGASWEAKDAAANSLTPTKEASPRNRKPAERKNDAGRSIVAPGLEAETRRSKRLSLGEKRELAVRDLNEDATAEEEDARKTDSSPAAVTETKKRPASSRMLRELESRLKDGDEDTVITRATKLPETAQLSKRGRLVAPRLAFWKNEFFERDQAGRIVGISRPSLEKTTPSKSRDVLIKQEPVMKVEETAVKTPFLRKDDVGGRMNSKTKRREGENGEESRKISRGGRELRGEAKVSEEKQGGKPKGTISHQKKRDLAKAQEMEKLEEGGGAHKSGQASKVSNKRKLGEGLKSEKKARDRESEKPTDNLWRLRRGHKQPKLERPFSADGFKHVAEGEPSVKAEEQPQPSMSEREEGPGPSGRLQSETNKGRRKEEIDYAELNGERPRRSRPKRGVVQEGPVNSEGAELQSGNTKKRRLQGPVEDLREHKKEKLVSELIENGNPIEEPVGGKLADGISPPSRRTKAKKGSDVSTKEKAEVSTKEKAEVSTGKKASGDGFGKEKAVGQNTKSKEARKEGAATDSRTLRRLRKRSDPETIEEGYADGVLKYLAEVAEKVAEDFGNESVDGPRLNTSGMETVKSEGESKGKRKSASAASETGLQNGSATKDGSEENRQRAENEGARTASGKQLSDEQSKGEEEQAIARLASKGEDERPVSLEPIAPAAEKRDSMEGNVSQGHVSAPQQSHVPGKSDACVSTDGWVLEKRAQNNGGRSESIHIKPVHTGSAVSQSEPIHTAAALSQSEPVHTGAAVLQSAAAEGEPVDKTGWTASQVAALKEALASIDPTVDGLWYKVARQVPGKNHVECQAKHNEAYATPPVRPHYPRRFGMSPPPRIIIQGAGKALARATNQTKARGFVGVQMQGVRAAREILRAQQAKQLQEAEDPLAFHVGDSAGHVPAVSPPILKPVQPQEKYIDDALHRRLQAQRKNKVLGQGGVTADLGFEGVSNEQIKGAAERIAEAAESARMLREKAAARIEEEEEVLVGDEEDEDDDDRPPFA